MLDLLEAHPWSELFWASVGGVGFAALCAGLGAARSVAAPGGGTGARQAPPQDQLEAIEGIGPRIAAHLRARGIGGFADLAARTPEQLRASLRVNDDFALAEPASWPLQARLLARGNIEQFLRLAVALNAGVPRLEDIDGIGTARAALLRAGGIRSLRELAASTPARVEPLVAGTSGPPPAIAAWISQAGALHDGDAGALARLANLSRLATLPLPPVEPTGPATTGSAGTATPWRDRLLDPRLCPLLPALALMLLLIGLSIGSYFWRAHAGDQKTDDRRPISPTPQPSLPDPQPAGSCSITPTAITRRFDSGGDKLRPVEHDLDTFVHDLASVTGRRDGTLGPLIIVGHADTMRYARPGGNWKLAQDRADHVRTYLSGALHWPDNLVFVYGRGATTPSGNTTKCRRGASLPAYRDCLHDDRRVEVTAFHAAAPARPAPPPTK